MMPTESHNSQESNTFIRTFFLGLVLILSGILIGVLAARFLPLAPSAVNTLPANSAPTTYDECLKSPGSIIQESYPATCVTTDGAHFVQPIPTASASADPTAGWKTYTNNYGNYEIKYPSDFSRIVCPDEENQLYLVQNGGAEDPIINSTCARDSRYPIEIFTDTKPIIIKGGSRYNVSTNVATISGLTAKKYISTQKTTFEGPGETWFTDVIFTTKGKYYDVYLRNQDWLAVFDQILSTFKLLNASPSATITY